MMRQTNKGGTRRQYEHTTNEQHDSHVGIPKKEKNEAKKTKRASTVAYVHVGPLDRMGARRSRFSFLGHRIRRRPLHHVEKVGQLLE